MMNEGAALRVLSYLNDTNQQHVESLATEKRKVTVIGEENEPDELIEEEEEEEAAAAVNDEEENFLTPEQIKAFFKAVEDGSVERLDDLFDTVPNADPDITHYAESLLMAAIRAKRRKVAEYLIDQLAINVSYSTDLIEFRLNTKIPIRERTMSCRDLAYEHGMMNLVDLIDIASDEVRPSIKRYLQRRLKARLNEIHQAYTKRLKERDHRLTILKQEKENQILEIAEEESESVLNTGDESSLPPPAQAAPVQISNRPYKSHIEETIKQIQSKNEKSIDETGKKAFRFSNYTLRYQLVEAPNTKRKTSEEDQPPKHAPFTLPPISPNTSPQPVSRLVSRPTTAATVATTTNQRPTSVVSARLPVRETRTSISRSARHMATPGVTSSVIVDNKSETKPIVTTSINTTERLLPKRNPSIRPSYTYVPHIQRTVYLQPRRTAPVTFKATAVGLSSETRLIRD